jgi:hypothetical protein
VCFGVLIGAFCMLEINFILFFSNLLTFLPDFVRYVKFFSTIFYLNYKFFLLISQIYDYVFSLVNIMVMGLNTPSGGYFF